MGHNIVQINMQTSDIYNANNALWMPSQQPYIKPLYSTSEKANAIDGKSECPKVSLLAGNLLSGFGTFSPCTLLPA